MHYIYIEYITSYYTGTHAQQQNNISLVCNTLEGCCSIEQATDKNFTGKHLTRRDQ